MTSLDEIKSLLEEQSQSAKPDNVGKLEKFVAAQVTGKAPYVFDANRLLLKLYSFYPEQSNEAITAQVLLLSLLEFPSTDLLALLCLVPNPTDEPSATVIRCAELLDSCQFAEFWTAFQGLQSHADLSTLVTSSKERLCKAIASVLALTYRSAPLEFVQGALNEQTEEGISQFVEKIDGSTVYFAATADNTKRDRVYQEGVTFGEISTLINKSMMVAKE